MRPATRHPTQPLHGSGRAVFLPLLALILVSACAEPTASRTTETVTIGVPNQPTAALLHLALDRDLFAEQGLDVKPVFYDSGKLALSQGLISGRVDYAITSEIPFLWQIHQEKDLRVLASINTTDNANRIVARRDRGIETITDLPGKVIGTQQFSAVHYFLHTVLHSLGRDRLESELRYLPAEKLPQALAEGRIDAFAMREPYISQAVALLGDNAVVFSRPGLYLQSELLVVRQGTLNARPEVARRLLRALVAAEDFARHRPEEMVAIVARRIDANPQRITRALGEGSAGVILDQSLLPLLEAEMRWLQSERYIEGETSPDLLAQIAPEPLAAVHPHGMLIVR